MSQADGLGFDQFHLDPNYSSTDSSDSSGGTKRRAMGRHTPMKSPTPDEMFRQLSIGSGGAPRIAKRNSSRNASPQVRPSSGKHIAMRMSPSGSLTTFSKPIVAQAIKTNENFGGPRDRPNLGAIESGKPYVSARSSTGDSEPASVHAASVGIDPSVKGRAKQVFKRWATWPHVLEAIGIVAGGIAIYATHASLGAILGQIIIPIPGVGAAIGALLGASLSTAAAATLGGIINLVIWQVVFSGLVLGGGAIHHWRINKSEENRVWRGQQRLSLQALRQEHSQLLSRVPDKTLIDQGVDLLAQLDRCIAKNKRKEAEGVKGRLDENFAARRRCQSYKTQAESILGKHTYQGGRNNLAESLANDFHDDIPSVFGDVAANERSDDELDSALRVQDWGRASLIVKGLEGRAAAYKLYEQYDRCKLEHEQLSQVLGDADPNREHRQNLIDGIRDSFDNNQLDHVANELKRLQRVLNNAWNLQAERSVEPPNDGVVEE